ncbi:MAG TPA: NAD(P)-binding domain-containing protein [Candidatus Limnocylindrales bacterium]|nr:NAD(P)-binding domain-containing protein [Candidatus Limnocylindrales bacterium]
MDAQERPFPPGEYPVLVIGSGPGGLQVSYGLRSHGIEHAVISADDGPGGMFLRWPFFQRLLSWTKPYAPVQRGTREYERYDWNSLLASEPDARAISAGFLDGASYFPSRPAMQRNLETFAERAAIRVRYGTRWERTRRVDGPDGGTTFVVDTTDGEYRCRVLILAVGIAQPSSPPTPGIELARHYADTREAATYAGKRIFIIGKQNSGFELATGLAPWASSITVCSPTPAKTSVQTKSLAGVRARYVQPFEDGFLGLGVRILDASITGLTAVGDAIRVDLRRTSDGEAMCVEADEVIAATGFTCPLLDLPDLGVATFGASGLPAVTPFWESASVPGIYFAGTISQAAQGLKKHGVPAHSGAVHGHRYNSLILARHIAETRFGRPAERPAVTPDQLVDYLLHEAANAPELWHQKAYLARVVTGGPGGLRDEGILPLVHALDGMSEDMVAMTVESDGQGGLYPVAYVRRAGALTEHALAPDPLLDFETHRHRAGLSAAVADLLGVASAN